MISLKERLALFFFTSDVSNFDITIFCMIFSVLNIWREWISSSSLSQRKKGKLLNLRKIGVGINLVKKGHMFKIKGVPVFPMLFHTKMWNRKKKWSFCIFHGWHPLPLLPPKKICWLSRPREQFSEQHDVTHHFTANFKLG